MRIIAKIFVIVAICLWAVGAFALLATYIGTRLIPTGYDYVSVFDMAGNQWIMPAWITAIAAIAAGFVLCCVLKAKENANWIPLVLGVVGAAAALIVALELKSALPVKVGTQYLDQGLTAWRLIWRHFTPVPAGVLVAVAAWLNRTSSRDERIYAENEAYKEHYDLSGDAVFADSTIGLETYAEDFGIPKPKRKLKRSLRKKVQK